MFDIYLENYLDANGNVVERSQQPVLSIPTDDPHNVCFTGMTFKAEVGKAESFDFSVNPGSPYYNAFLQFKTRVRIVYDGTIICYARVVTVNTSTMLHVRAVHCEGMYAVLGDSQIEGEEEELQSKSKVIQHLQSIINEHNSEFPENSADAWKRIVFDPDGGQSYSSKVTAEFDRNEMKKRGSTSWGNANSAIDALVGNYGGYPRIRYSIDSGTGKVISRLDWLKDYYRDPQEDGGTRAHIQVSKNLIDFSSSSEISEIFTRVIPIGQKTSTVKKKESRYIYLENPGHYYSVTQVCSDYNNDDAILNSGFHRKSDYENAENNYGIIYKTINFQNANTLGKLQEYTKDWVRKNYYGALRTFSVKALDMHMLGDSDTKILVGDIVDFTYPEYDGHGNTVLITRKLLCKSATYNLLNPDQNSYTLGIPNDALDFEYGEKKKATKKASSTAAAAAAATSSRPPSKPKVVTFTDVSRYLLWFYYTRDYYEGVTISHEWYESYRQRHNVNYPDDSNDIKAAADGEYKAERKRLAHLNAVSHHAYSWSRGGGNIAGNNNNFDKNPYNTFIANKEYCTKDETSGETSYVYADIAWYVIEGDNGPEPKFRIMGHYRITPCDRYKFGVEYGVAYNENSDDDNDPDVVVFLWPKRRDKNIPIEFRFENFWMGTSGGASAASGSSESEGEVAATQSSMTVNEETGASEWIDPNTGEVKASISIDGGAGFGDLRRWVDDDGNEVPAGTEGAHDVQVIDPQTGLPVWQIEINKPITYWDPDQGKEVTVSGCIIANDLKVGNIPSFITEMGIVRNLIAERAYVGELYANVAILGHADPITDSKGNITGVNGTQLEVNSDNMIGAVGLFQKDENGRIKYVDGKPCIDAGAAIVMDDDEATFGLWHTGNLTGGMMVKKINSQTTTTIRGDVINLENGVDSEGNATGQVKLTEAMIISSSDGATILNFKKIAHFDADVTLTSGTSGSGLLKAPYVAARSKILFPDSDEYNGNSTVSSETYLDRDRTNELVSGSYPHVKITGPDQNNQYTLWYKPAGLPISSATEDPLIQANGWKNAGNFSRAASGGALTATWSSSSHIFPYTVSNGSETVTIGFGSQLLGAKDVNLNISTDMLTPAEINGNSNYNLTVPYTVVDLVWDSEGGQFNPVNRYTGGTIVVNGKNAYDKGWRNAYNQVDYPDVISSSSVQASMNIVFPNRNVDGSPLPTTYHLLVEQNDAYICEYDASDNQINYAHVKHNQYNSGWYNSANIASINPITASGSVTQNFNFIKPNKNSPGNSQTIQYYMDIDNNYAYVKDPDDDNIARIPNPAYANGWNKGITAYDPSNPNTSGGVEISIGARTTSGTTLVAGSELPIKIYGRKSDGSRLSDPLYDVTYTVPSGSGGSHTITDFSIDAGSGYTSGGFTNNADGYSIGTVGGQQTVGMVVGTTWKCDDISVSKRYNLLTSTPTKIWKSVDFNSTFSWDTATTGTRYKRRKVTIGLTNGNSTTRYAKLEQTEDLNTAYFRFGTSENPSNYVMNLSLSHPADPLNVENGEVDLNSGSNGRWWYSSTDSIPSHTYTDLTSINSAIKKGVLGYIIFRGNVKINNTLYIDKWYKITVDTR